MNMNPKGFKYHNFTQNFLFRYCQALNTRLFHLKYDERTLIELQRTDFQSRFFILKRTHRHTLHASTFRHTRAFASHLFMRPIDTDYQAAIIRYVYRRLVNSHTLEHDRHERRPQCTPRCVQLRFFTFRQGRCRFLFLFLRTSRSALWNCPNTDSSAFVRE